MNLLFQSLEGHLEHRSKREKALLIITLILLIYLCFFHSFFANSLDQILRLEESIQQSQTYLESNKTQNIAKDLLNAQQLNVKLNSLIETLNSQSLPLFEALKQINDYALFNQITLWEVDTKEESSSYLISLVGHAPLNDLFSFLDFVENLPLIHLASFEILRNGDFKLTLQDHLIRSDLPSYGILASDIVLQNLHQALQKQKLSFSFLSPSDLSMQASIQDPLELQALFNQRAKINGKWLKRGEMIEEYKLQNIQDGKVLLQSKDKILELKLKKSGL